MSDALPSPPVIRTDLRIHDLVQTSLAAAHADRAIADIPDDVKIVIERPKNPEHGQWSTNLALRIAKHVTGKTPVEIAEILRSHLPSDIAVDQVTVAPPGFLNFTLSRSFMSEQLHRILPSPTAGVQIAELPARIVVDYSSPNVAKEMHVGHLRSTIIGDALCRILTFLGHIVIRENHIGDWGTPFGMLIEHLSDIGEDQSSFSYSVGDLTAFYQEARKKFDADPSFTERSRNRVVLLQSGDTETLRLWQILVGASIAYFEAIYHDLDILLQPEDVVGESYYNPMLPSVVADLRTLDLLVESEGALCVFPAGFANRDGTPLPLIVQKSDGGYGYAATDLAAIRDRVERHHADRILDVVGTPQSQHFAMCFAVATMAHWLPSTVHAQHIAFGQMLGEDHKVFHTREGTTVRLRELVDEAVQRATTAISARSPGLDAAAVASLAHTIGIGAIKYADLSNDRIKDYVFDWDRMLSFEGNTGPYLQYAHARICSIFRRAGLHRADARAQVSLDTPQEFSLGKQLLEFTLAIEETLVDYRPHILCTYLYELASAFTTFYEACPVLTAPTPEIRESRLALCAMTARVLSEGLGLLGITAPESM